GDNRLFARALIDSNEALALLDSPACVNFLGKGPEKFWKGKEAQITTLRAQSVRNANGSEIPGLKVLLVSWDCMTKGL
ncbi:unnamed protein product, partial [Ceratitis capitata]